MKIIFSILAFILALSFALPPEWIRILCLGWIGVFVLMSMIGMSGINRESESTPRVQGYAKNPAPYPCVQGYVITPKHPGKNGSHGSESVVSRVVAERAARTGDYEVRTATYKDAGNNYQNDGLSTPGGGWVPGGMLVDDGTKHTYNDTRLNK